MNNKIYLVIIASFLFSSFISCKGNNDSNKSAAQIIDSTIAAHGGQNYQHMDVSFTFRQYRVRLQNENGNFIYSREFKDSSGNQIKDVLTNDSFNRTLNDSLQKLTEESKNRFASSLNSVAYFALLPYKLKEPAVIPAYLGDTSFAGAAYYKLAISYKAEGKQNNHQDDYCYWINQKNYRVEFISYKTGGPRMRKAIAVHECGGIIFQDYDNYAMEDSTIAVKDFDRYFLEGKMKLLSTITNTDFVDNHK